MAVSNGPHTVECTSSCGSVVQEVVFGVKGFRDDCQCLQHSQLNLPVIHRVLTVTFGKIPNALKIMCG